MRSESVRVFSSFPQVNGKELSKSSHEETVEAFRAAKDPVVVQVIRRTPSGRPHGPPQEIHVVDVCTQTDITFEHIMALAKLRPSTPPVPDVCPFLLSDRYVSLHFCELGMSFLFLFERPRVNAASLFWLLLWLLVIKKEGEKKQAEMKQKYQR